MKLRIFHWLLILSLALDGFGAATAVWVDRRNGGWDLYQAVLPTGGSWGANTLLVASPLPGGMRSPASGDGAIDMPMTVAGGQVTDYSKATTSDPYLLHNVYMYANTGQLARIDVTPSSANLSVGQQQQFSATGYDALGNEVPVSPTWSATGGTTTPGGLYTAGNLPGRYQVAAAVGQVRDLAWVRITGPAYCPDLGPGQAWEHTFPIRPKRDEMDMGRGTSRR